MMKGKNFLAWFWVGLCGLAILFVVPFSRAIQAFAAKLFGPAFFMRLLLAAAAAAFLAILYVLVIRLRIREAGQYVWLIVFAAIYFYLGLVLIQNPNKCAHYLEYGLLGFLLFRAWRLTIAGELAYFAAFFSAALVGIADEFIQWITPGRYWSLKDIGMNALGAGLVLLSLRKGIKPKVAAGPALDSLRTVSVLLAVDLIALGLCLSNTPRRTAALAARIPVLVRLVREEPMRETILRHIDPEIGAFYSRLTTSALQKTDLEQAEAYGRILSDWKYRRYDEFLDNFMSMTYPFLYEIRIHIFRRDRRFELGRQTDDASTRKDNFFIAYKENRVLEKYFGSTLRRSVYLWDEKRTSEVESRIDKSAAYDSPVSKSVFYWLKEGSMWAAILVILGLLAGFNIAMARRRR